MSEPKDFFNRNRFIPERLVNLITSDPINNGLKTPITVKGGDVIWHYKHELGIWKDNGIAHVKDIAKEALGKRWKPAYINEVVYGTLIDTYIRPEEFVEDPNLIVMKNGTLNLDTLELADHNWQDYAKAALPVNYDPAAECPEILKFLAEVIPDAIDTFQEWLGYHLHRDMIYHKAAMFIGDGANGKTTLQDIMNAFLGPDNVSHVNLYKLVEGKFSTSELYLKLGNISPEIASGELKRTGVFKSLTGHDRIMAERKYRDPFYFTNYAKLTFLCNQLPTTPDMTSAFFRRWLLFTFPNTFEGDNCDTKILENLITSGELSGLMNWALIGLQRLQENGKFTKSLSADEMQELYETMSDPITAFIATEIISSTSGAELKDDVYKAYYRFCRNKGYVAVSQRTFTIELKPRIAGLGESTRKIKGHRGRCWVGIRLVGVTQGTQVTLPTPDSKNNHIERGYTSVPSVPCVTISEDSKVKMVLPEQKQHLITDAILVIKEFEGRMHQEEFFSELFKMGHHYIGASLELRGDPRFRFMGLEVKYLGPTEENKPGVKKSD